MTFEQANILLIVLVSGPMISALAYSYWRHAITIERIERELGEMKAERELRERSAATTGSNSVHDKRPGAGP